MKKNQHQDQQNRDAEILKAVAQAWHSRSSGSSSRAASEETSEYDTLRRRSTGTPSRFRIEAMRTTAEDGKGRRWDFGQSLWDSYEILSVSRKLETGLVMEEDGPFEEAGRAGRRRESSRSLRSLFNRMSSRRFSEQEEEE